MLRNRWALSRMTRVPFLNEVLSLNAQEFHIHQRCGQALFLNEVLSLNAQELGCLTRVVAFALLNEG